MLTVEMGLYKSAEKECSMSEIMVWVDDSGRVDSRGPGTRGSNQYCSIADPVLVHVLPRRAQHCRSCRQETRTLIEGIRITLNIFVEENFRHLLGKGSLHLVENGPMNGRGARRRMVWAGQQTRRGTSF